MNQVTDRQNFGENWEEISRPVRKLAVIQARKFRRFELYLLRRCNRDPPMFEVFVFPATGGATQPLSPSAATTAPSAADQVGAGEREEDDGAQEGGERHFVQHDLHGGSGACCETTLAGGVTLIICHSLVKT